MHRETGDCAEEQMVAMMLFAEFLCRHATNHPTNMLRTTAILPRTPTQVFSSVRFLQPSTSPGTDISELR